MPESVGRKGSQIRVKTCEIGPFTATIIDAVARPHVTLLDHGKTQPCEYRNGPTVVSYHIKSALGCIEEPMTNPSIGPSSDMEADTIAEVTFPPLDHAAVANIEQRWPEIAVANASGDGRRLRRNGLSLWAAGALEDAAIALGLAARFAPRNPALLTDLGSVLSALGRKSEAVPILHASLGSIRGRCRPGSLWPARIMSWAQTIRRRTRIVPR